MSIAKYSIQPEPPLSPREMPTMYDLPSEDAEESGLPDEYHLWQPQILSFTFCPPNYPPEQVFTLRLLLGFESPGSGSVYYDGQDLTKLLFPKRERDD